MNLTNWGQREFQFSFSLSSGELRWLTIWSCINDFTAANTNAELLKTLSRSNSRKFVQKHSLKNRLQNDVPVLAGDRFFLGKLEIPQSCHRC